MAKHIDTLNVDENPKALSRVSNKKYDYSEFDSAYDNENYGPNTPDCIDLYDMVEKGANIDATIIAKVGSEIKPVRLNRESFLKAASIKDRMSFREIDAFNMDDYQSARDAVGAEDFVPVMGGPFFKNLYYTDYIKAANQAFFAYNNDPAARRAVQIVKDFTLGRGFRVDCKHPGALALWNAFEKVNDFKNQFEQMSIELQLYGEVMWRWLPELQSKIEWQRPDDQKTKSAIPRVRLVDPTACWEVVTFPEDITDVIFYQFVFNTQQQIYTAQNVPSTKFIYEQVPSKSIMHYKTNSVSNEKRGRSDLYPGLGYLKRMRDTINYAMVKDLKAAQWAIDTEIDGGDEDIQAYMNSLDSAGKIGPAGSEFVHNKRVIRKPFEPSSSGGASAAWEWNFSMFCMAVGIPTNYFGTHMERGTARAGAIIATEPVGKKFECRQMLYERMLIDISRRLFDWAGLPQDVQIEVSFPDIMTADRSQKLKDLALANSEGYICKRRASELAAKELGITDFDYDLESAEIKKEPVSVVSQGVTPLQSQSTSGTPKPAIGVTGQERNQGTET